MAEKELSERIAERVLEKIEDKKEKKRGFKLPFGVTSGAKSKIKKGYVLLILIKNNGAVNMSLKAVDNQMVYLSDNHTYHLASSDYIGYYKNYPTIILYEGNLEPLKLNKLNEEAEEKGTSADPQKVIINAIEMANARLKSTNIFAGKGWFWLFIIGAVVLYLIYTGITGQPAG